ncbi:hypothetical protein EGI16_21530 [Chryseobacterium sp. G0240]|uniref:hypothetical protein n=1 Tax=Chryseobacterium sp. G0240 TaxID=2487066 RepID=UPI000F4551F6|nr:hypothetical protein [Chryseobacterium sp. G0240]ROH98419.1 hypothetical protein EGI16_21530 [Chryseobacterium sp. G0240]
MKLDIKFLQTGGIPLTNDLMADVMLAIKHYDCIADVTGHMAIVSGCTITGTYVSPGIVAINGELLFFEGGGIVSSVYVNTEIINKTFQDTISKGLIEKKTVKFGAGTISYPWGEFKRLTPLLDLQSQVAALKSDIDILKIKTAPIMNDGVIFIWNKPANDIPDGWKECTDLRGKTVFGWHPTEHPFTNLNTDIGSKTKTIEKTNLPSVTVGTNIYTNGGGYKDDWPNDNIGPAVNGSEIQTKQLGDGTALDVLNPGRIIMFIEPNFQ